MTIERLAVFAVSIAFTVSLVLYPDLPSDVPPRAGRHGPPVGTPFLAFFLPFAALVFWWLLTSLGRSTSARATCAVRAGAAAAVLVAAFHVAMLAALVGWQPWNVRPRFVADAVSADGAMRVVPAALHARPWKAGAAVLAGLSAGGRVEPQTIPDDRLDSLPAFLDATVPGLMEAGHVPGTAIAVVHRGRTIALRGYGHSRLESGTRVDPSRTVFHIGSVSKSLTAVAVLQLVDAGMLDLHRDIRAYLPDVPLRYGATMHQLLTHTAGLDERYAGTSTDRLDYLATLSDRIWRRPPEQVIRPGTVYSYANTHFALAGRVIERSSGVSYGRYMADRVFGPLSTAGTTAFQPPPPPLDGDLARGYRWRDGRHEALPTRFGYESAAGGIVTTAADMGRIIAALLGDGSVDGRRLLSRESVTALLAAQYTPDPRIPGTTYGFTHWVTHGQHLLHADGTSGGQIGVLVLAPDHALGVFAASNELPGVANHILAPLLTHLFGPEPPPAPPIPLAGVGSGGSRVAGWYRNYHHTRHEMSRAIALMLQSPVRAEADGAIRWRGRRWVPVAPLVFTSSDGRDTIAFREGPSGAITALLPGFAALAWHEAWWTRRARIGYSAFTTLAVLFLVFLNYWKLLGFRY
jgi:CubicO group peptidase (beta-lactamase class C family)